MGEWGSGGVWEREEDNINTLTHHQAVHEEVSIAEGDEVLGHGDALLGAHLLHLEHGATDRQTSELNPVVTLIFWFPNAKRWVQTDGWGERLFLY